MSYEQFVELLDRFGVAGVILIAIAYGTFRVARWIAPKAEAVFSRHLELIDTLRESISSLKETAIGFKQIVEGILDTQKGVVDATQAVLKNQEDLRREIGEIKDHVRVIRDKG